MEGRLMMAKMVLENFKSYGGVKVVGPFHKRVSAVVGPNGSGKSNVLDALQFVMGKRATKMRLKKVSELIHKSENMPNCDYAKVSVYFQNIIDDDPEGDGYTVVEGSEVVVSRVAYASNASKYFIDDSSASFSQVRTLLMDRGIDLSNNRSMVLQGEIEQISMMKPKAATEHEMGLLEFLEDIIGSNQFVDEIDEAGKAAEAMNEERTSHLHRVKVVEKERMALESSKAEAEAYMLQEQELCAKRFVLYQVNRRQTATQADALKERVAVAQQEYDTLQDAIGSTSKDLSATEAKFKSVQKEHAKVTRALADAKKEFESYERKDVKYREDVKHCKSKIKKNAKAGVAAAAKVEAAKTSLAQAEEDAASAQAALEKHHTKIEQLDAKLDVLNGQLAAVTSEFQADIEEAQKAAMPHVEAKAAAQAALDLAASEVALITSKAEKAGAALTKAQSELDAYRSSRDSQSAKLEETKAQLESAKGEAKQVDSDIREAATLEAEMSKDVATLRSSIEETKTSLQSMSSATTVVDELLKLRDSGKLPGIYGRLGDLGVIDDEYDVAVSTAGGALRHIVVDTPETGSKAVAYLRKHSLGIATFIILSELEYLSKYMAASPDSFPAPRLYDLITPSDAKFAPAFFYAVKNTLVAPSLDDATAVAFDGKRRFRVVTTDGQLIDTSGTMSGGGNKVVSGLMLTSSTASASSAAVAAAAESVVSAENLAVSEEELRGKMAALSAIRAEMESLRKRGYKLKTTIAKLQTAVTKLEMDIAAGAASEPVLVAKIESYAAAAEVTEEDAARLEELKATVEEQTDAVTKATIVVDAFDAEIKVLQEKILEAGGMELRKAKSSRESAVQQADLAETALTKANVAIKSSQKALTKATKALEASEQEATSLGDALSKMEAEFATLEADAVGVLQSYKQTQVFMEEKEDELGELKVVFEGQKKAYHQLQSQEVEMVDRLNELQRMVKEYERRVAEWGGKMEAVEGQYATSVMMFSGATAEAAAKVVEEDEDEDEEGGEEVDMDVESGNDGDDGEEEEEEEEAGEAFVVKKAKEKRPKLRVLSNRKLDKMSREELEAEIGLLEEAMEKASPNISVIQEYRAKEEEYVAKVELLDQVTAKRDEVRETFDGLRKKRLDMFMAGFRAIGLKLKEIYQLITMGGDAELECVDSLNPMEGILFSVRPRGKSWVTIARLSGGEKTLASLALIFALHHYKPTPLYIFDEIDAALDYANVSLVAEYLKERARDASLLIVSLRSNMFEKAQRLIGVHKVRDVTNTVTITPSALVLGGTGVAAT